MSISNTISLLQTKYLTLTTLVAAAPADLPTTELSLTAKATILTVDASGSWQKVAGETSQRRVYESTAFLTKADEALRPLAYTRMKTLKQAMGELLTTPANKILANPPDLVQILSEEPGGIEDTDLRTLRYLRQPYYGFKVRVLIHEITL